MDNLRHESVMFRYSVGQGVRVEPLWLSGFLEAVMFRYLFLRMDAIVGEGMGDLDLY